MLTRPPSRADSRSSALGRFHERGPHPKASCCERRLAKRPPPPISKSKKAKRRRASPAASTGDQEFAARRSAPARPRIKSPITQPEMPERTHAHEPLGQRFRSARAEAYPIAPRRPHRNRWPRGRPRARVKRKANVNAAPFPSRFKEQCARPIPRARATSEGQLLRAAVGEAPATADLKVQKSKAAAGLAGGQHRRPGIRRAPFGARTPTDQEPDHPA